MWALLFSVDGALVGRVLVADAAVAQPDAVVWNRGVYLRDFHQITDHFGPGEVAYRQARLAWWSE